MLHHAFLIFSRRALPHNPPHHRVFDVPNNKPSHPASQSTPQHRSFFIRIFIRILIKLNTYNLIRTISSQLNFLEIGYFSTSPKLILLGFRFTPSTPPKHVCCIHEAYHKGIRTTPPSSTHSLQT